MAAIRRDDQEVARFAAQAPRAPASDDANAADLNSAKGATTSYSDAADRQPLDASAGPDTDAADENPLHVIPAAQPDPADPDPRERALDAESEHPDANPVDATRAGHGEAERDTIHRPFRRRVRTPERRVDAVDFLELAVAKIQPHAVHSRFVADGETVAVNRQVDDLRVERSGEECPERDEEAGRAHCGQEEG